MNLGEKRPVRFILSEVYKLLSDRQIIILEMELSIFYTVHFLEINNFLGKACFDYCLVDEVRGGKNYLCRYVFPTFALVSVMNLDAKA